jgi:hypothetical protein
MPEKFKLGHYLQPGMNLKMTYFLLTRLQFRAKLRYRR